jgi:transposase-like protein
MARYHAEPVKNESSQEKIWEQMETLAREGARRMIATALEEEVKEYLGRERYQRGNQFSGYRNGYGRERELILGTWTVEVRPPRVSDVPAGQDKFESQIAPKAGRRLSPQTQKLFCQLYLEGLSSGDFGPVFSELLGEGAPLSENTIVRLKESWQQEYEAWRHRSLEQEHYVYWWVDGIYLDAGLEKEHSCVLVVLGAKADGRKELVAMELGYRESKQSWADLLRSLRDRGLCEPKLVIADGNLGLWAALAEVYPQAARQRCWNHRMMNVLDKLPRRMQPLVRGKLSEIYGAFTRADAAIIRNELAAWLRKQGQGPAAQTLCRDWEDFVTFYDFPKEHWVHLKTTNCIESIFSGVRLRSDVAKRARRRDNALYLVFKIIQRLSLNWKVLNGSHQIMALVYEEHPFKDGLPKEVTRAA